MIKTWTGLIATILCSGGLLAADGKMRVEREPGAVVVRGPSGQLLLRYQVERPALTNLTVDSGCFFHPLCTPKGIPLTDLAPPDHPHHRGIFLGWVEMHGRKDADFWGWGEHAPKAGRRILSKGLSSIWAHADSAGFKARNEWRADDDLLVQEDMETKVQIVGPATVLDVTYRLKTDEELGLTRWAFGGFCVRGRREAAITMESPAGPVTLPNPVHTKPDTDWPAASWYDMAMQLPDGTQAGVAVMSHPKNPPTLWHNHRELRILNPVVCASAPLVMRAKKPLVLRYRVVAHDGPVPKDLLARLAAQWE